MTDDPWEETARPRRPARPARLAAMWLAFYGAIASLVALLGGGSDSISNASSSSSSSLSPSSSSASPPLRNMVYLTGLVSLPPLPASWRLTPRQHPLVPLHLPEFQYLTHLALAFMPSDVFNDPDGAARNETAWPLFTRVAAARASVPAHTRVLVAIGGWGDAAGFERGARSPPARRLFARNVAAMVAATGADGVDLDWEYPGGNGDDYRRVPNARKAWQVDAFPQLLAAVRAALGPGKTLSVAAPGRPEDIALAFPARTAPQIAAAVDFVNVMAYDLMNRRDRVTRHHTGVRDSLAAVDAYAAAGVPPRQINLGLAFYVKYFQTEHEDCWNRVRQGRTPVGCRTLLLEDPDTGADLGRAGAFAWHDAVPAAVQASFARARAHGVDDDDQGGHYYWDAADDLWWTFDTPAAIAGWKLPGVVARRRLGGVFAWGLGEDAPAYQHFRAMGQAWKKLNDSRPRDEL